MGKELFILYQEISRYLELLSPIESPSRKTHYEVCCDWFKKKPEIFFRDPTILIEKEPPNCYLVRLYNILMQF